MMERALKERIIGAVILVIFVVLVVPVFLDGPPEEGEIVSERVLLPGQEGQDTKTVVLDRERSEPIPVASSATAERNPVDDAPAGARVEEPVAKPLVTPQQSPQQTPQQEEPDTAPAPQPEVAQAASSTTGMWAVQLGSFSNKQNAEKLAADLRKQGYAAFLSQITTNAGALHRVRIGPQNDRDSAESMAARLLRVGHKGQVVPHP
jgi:DedD protein